MKLAIAPAMLLLLMLLPSPSQGYVYHPTTWIKVEVNYLKCYETTECSEDEVYFLTTGYWNHNACNRIDVSKRGPYDINDGDDDLPIRHTTLYRIGMRNYDSIELTFVFMEEDRGTAESYVDIANYAAGINFGGDEAETARETADSVYDLIAEATFDSDDLLGIFHCRLEFRNGVLYQEWWESIQCTYNGGGWHAGNLERDKYCHDFTLSGDGSNYDLLMKAFIE